MKKYLGIIAITATIILLTGCGKQTSITEENNTDRQEMSNSDVSDCKR
jgi:protein involved in sex pheromone biosynthesis